MERRPHTPPELEIPEPLPVHFDAIPERLQEYDRWVVWHYAIVDGEIKKPPFSPRTGKHASVRSCETWGSFQDAQRAYASGQFAGVGIVLFHSMGIVGIDIDHCIVDGQPNEEAQQIITSLDSYAEVSPSGTGVRIMLAGKLPGALRRRGTIEMYDDLRYLTITGHWLAHTPQNVQPRLTELTSVYQHIFHLDSREHVVENTGGGVGIAHERNTSLPDLMKPYCKKH